MADRYRVTLRSNEIELRGEVVGIQVLMLLADVVKPLGVMVLASPLDEDGGSDG